MLFQFPLISRFRLLSINFGDKVLVSRVGELVTFLLVRFFFLFSLSLNHRHKFYGRKKENDINAFRNLEEPVALFFPVSVTLVSSSSFLDQHLLRVIFYVTIFFLGWVFLLSLKLYLIKYNIYYII